MLPHRRALLGVAALSLLLPGCSVEAQRPQVLRFSAIPDEDTTELKARFDPVAAYLSEQLGVPVEYVPASDYQASVDLFVNGDVQLAWFGGLTGVQARRQVPGARAIAQGEVDPHYSSYFIANASTGIERSDEFPLALEGRTFTFGSESSTSGRMMPEYFIRQNTGRAPEAFFGSRPGFSGSHDKTAELVQSGAWDAGALSYKTYDHLVADGKIDPEVCRVVWRTPEYADYNWTAHPVLDEAFGAGTTERLQAALVGLRDPALLDALQREEGLIPADDEDFEALEELALELGLVR